MLILLAATISFQSGTIIAWAIFSPKMIHLSGKMNQKKLCFGFLGEKTFPSI